MSNVLLGQIFEISEVAKSSFNPDAHFKHKHIVSYYDVVSLKYPNGYDRSHIVTYNQHHTM